MNVLEKNIFGLVNSCMINVNRSTGIGAKFVCKYVALEGFSEKRSRNDFQSAAKSKKNIEKDWEFVKKGNRRNY